MWMQSVMQLVSCSSVVLSVQRTFELTMSIPAICGRGRFLEAELKDPCKEGSNGVRCGPLSEHRGEIRAETLGLHLAASHPEMIERVHSL